VTFVAPPFSATLFQQLLALNNAHAEELSYKTGEALAELIGAAHLVLAEPNGLAMVVTFSNHSTYNNPNFAWFKQRYNRFLYVDRVVVSTVARGKGLARSLYSAAENCAQQEKLERVVCEINLDPPNPASDAFHLALEFAPIGQQQLAGTSKTVRYWAKQI
jgi:uncharacterized protein